MASPGDCDDGNASVHPGAVEVCDSADTDEDCDGLADDQDRQAAGRTDYWPDDDGDGYGDDSRASVALCDGPSGFSAAPGDCDDADKAIHPAASEDCGTTDDDDCDDIVNDGCYVGGEVVITEIQHDPIGPEPQGHYIELFNTTPDDLYCDGLAINVDGARFVIAPDGLVLPSRSYAVLCYDDAVLGTWCDVVYGSDVNGESQEGETWNSAMDLDSVGTVEVSVDGTLLDQVDWGGGSWPTSSEGASFELSGSATTPLGSAGRSWMRAATNAGNWCLATSTYAGSEMGTPGQSPSCAP